MSVKIRGIDIKSAALPSGQYFTVPREGGGDQSVNMVKFGTDGTAEVPNAEVAAALVAAYPKQITLFDAAAAEVGKDPGDAWKMAQEAAEAGADAYLSKKFAAEAHAKGLDEEAEKHAEEGKKKDADFVVAEAKRVEAARPADDPDKGPAAGAAGKGKLDNFPMKGKDENKKAPA